MGSDAALDQTRAKPQAAKPRTGTRLATGIACFTVSVVALVAELGAGHGDLGAITAAAAFAVAVILMVDRIVDSWEHETEPLGGEIGAVFFTWGVLVLAIDPRDSFALASTLGCCAIVLGVAFLFMAPLTKWLSFALEYPQFTLGMTIAEGGRRKR
jgi:hypothetical protein